MVPIYNPTTPADRAAGYGNKATGLNDHSVIYGPNGTWHWIGIQHTSTNRGVGSRREGKKPTGRAFTSPLQQAATAGLGSNPDRVFWEVGSGFGHATVHNNVTSLGWKHQPFTLGVEAPETHLWAPHILYIEEAGLYFMFYCGGGADRARSMIRLATSRDLFYWEKRGTLFVAGIDGRDPMVLDRGKNFSIPEERFIIYYTGTNPDDDPRVAISNTSHVNYARMSGDLFTWGEERVVFERGPDGHNYAGPCESPFVVQKGEDYYLFNGPYNHYDLLHTRVWHSKDPLNFGSLVQGTAVLVRKVETHAPEIVRDQHGKWFITKVGDPLGGLFISELTWEEPILPGERTSPPVPPLLPSAGPPLFPQNVDHGTQGPAGWAWGGPAGFQTAGDSAQWELTPSGLALGCAMGPALLMMNPPTHSEPVPQGRIAWDSKVIVVTSNGDIGVNYNTGVLLALVGDQGARGVYVNASVDTHRANPTEPYTAVIALHRASDGAPLAGPAAIRLRLGEAFMFQLEALCDPATLGGNIINIKVEGSVVVNHVTVAHDELLLKECGGTSAPTMELQAGVGIWTGSAIVQSLLRQRNPRYFK